MARALLSISSCTVVQMLTTWMRWEGSSPPEYLQLYRGAATDYLDEMGMAPALLSISSCTGVQMLTTWMRWAWLLPS